MIDNQFSINFSENKVFKVGIRDLLMNLCVVGRRLFVNGQNKDLLDLPTPFY